jgi:hypothetical protein
MKCPIVFEVEYMSRSRKGSRRFGNLHVLATTSAQAKQKATRHIKSEVKDFIAGGWFRGCRVTAVKGLMGISVA